MAECQHTKLTQVFNTKTGVYTYLCETPGCGYWSTYDSSRNPLAHFKDRSNDSSLKPVLPLSREGKL